MRLALPKARQRPVDCRVLFRDLVFFLGGEAEEHRALENINGGRSPADSGPMTKSCFEKLRSPGIYKSGRCIEVRKQKPTTPCRGIFLFSFLTPRQR